MPWFYFYHYYVFTLVVGADVLDLAETMVASDGLQYEPVSILLFSKMLAVWKLGFMLMQ